MLSVNVRRFLLTLALGIGACSSASSDVLGVFRPLKPGTSDYLRLQDFCIFRQGNYTYIASMKKDYCNQGILVARSSNLQEWEVLGDAVSTRTPEDAAMVWAPHVVEDGGVYYMFYTGVTVPTAGAWCQRILVASTSDPSKPANWQRNYSVQFLVNGQTQSWFRPSHSGAVWSDTTWADCRDPMVLKYRGTWYMFYSGTDTTGGIMGVATAPSVLGPWTDHGAAMKVAAGSIPESCFVLEAPNGSFVLTTNHAGGIGTSTARGKSLLPSGSSVPFSDQRPIADTTGTVLPGWAHEFLPRDDGSLLCGHLTGYYVTLRDAYLRGETFGWTVNAAPTPATCAYAKSTPSGTAVELRGAVVSGVFPDCIYVQEPDRSNGVRVVGSFDAAPGDRINAAGKSGVIDTEAAVLEGYVSSRVPGDEPKPLMTGVRGLGGAAKGLQSAAVDNADSGAYAAGLGSTGLLVRIAGKVDYFDPAGLFAYIDDGSGVSDGSGHRGVRLLLDFGPVPLLGSYASVTGCCGTTSVGGRCARAVRPRQDSDVQYSKVANWLRNGGFETGSYSPWIYSGTGGGIRTGTYYSVTPHTGSYFFGCYGPKVTYSGTLRQTVTVPAGNYRASVWSVLFHPYTTDPEVTKNRIGIDPTGGTDPGSGSVVWSEWDTTASTTVTPWHEIMTPVVNVPGGQCTVFLEYLQQNAAYYHNNCFDDARLLAVD